MKLQQIINVNHDFSKFDEFAEYPLGNIYRIFKAYNSILDKGIESRGKYYAKTLAVQYIGKYCLNPYVSKDIRDALLIIVRIDDLTDVENVMENENVSEYTAAVIYLYLSMRYEKNSELVLKYIENAVNDKKVEKEKVDVMCVVHVVTDGSVEFVRKATFYRDCEHGVDEFEAELVEENAWKDYAGIEMDRGVEVKEWIREYFDKNQMYMIGSNEELGEFCVEVVPIEMYYNFG